MDNINIDKVDNRQQHHYVPDEKDDTDWCVVSGRDRWSARLAPRLRLLVCDGQTWKMGKDFLYILRYENGCLTPDMGSVFIALDPAVKENGCLQVGC